MLSTIKKSIIENSFSQFCNRISEKGINAIKDFCEKVSQEYEETKVAGQILKKYYDGGYITPEEEIVLKQQIYDVLKSVGIAIPLALIPGSSILLPIIIKVAKRFNINILPSSFNGEKK